MSASAARELGMHVGSVLPMGFFTNAQLRLQGCCTANGKGKLAPHLKVDLKLVGIAVFNTEIIEDDIDSLGDVPVVLSPALIAKLVRCCSFYTNTAIKVEGGNRNVPAVPAEIARAAPKLDQDRRVQQRDVHVGRGAEGRARDRARVDRARRVRRDRRARRCCSSPVSSSAVSFVVEGDERAVLRALGAGPATTVGDGLFGVIGAVRSVRCWPASSRSRSRHSGPSAPSVRVEHPGIAFDWTVLGTRASAG